MFFNGTINGEQVTGHGSIEQIFAQQAAKNPNFVIPEPIAADKSELVPRYKTNTNCIPVPHQNWKGTSPSFIRDGIKYLNGVTNFCTVWAKSCSRVSCSYDSAIIVCNDSFVHHHHSCKYIASYAQDILDKCSVYTREDKTWRVGGQEWDTDRYNVIVRYEESRC
ncbi:hypothetical protein DL98DRAFT_508926 [Cadophora sp. DSE1049]|nr:hypothetical protein DL98DRAFT_508926 [Cadophora sp. DSE1049]